MSKKMSVIIAALMILSMLAACGPAAAPAPAAAPTQAAAAPAAAQPTAAPAAPAAAAQPAGGPIKELNLIWAQWDPANYLAELVKDYEKETGIKVNVIQEPWGSYYNRVSAEWAAKGCAFDMLVGDSQWTGQGATQGHYVELTDFLKSNGLDKTVTPATLKYYAEYPPNSGKLWAFPTEGDADGWAYRKDLFEDPKEMSGFKAKYGYDLAVPKDYKQLHDIAEWFYRPTANPPLYGIAVYTQKDYDAITMTAEQGMFSYGGEWQDKDNKVDGVVNSKQNIEAVQMMKDLYNFGPPGNNNSFYPEMNNYFTSGQAAVVMNFFAFMPALANKATNPFADKTGYFANPAGPGGARGAALGGQGLNISAHCPKERQDAALAFLKWFAQDSVQAKWAQLGGYTCNSKVLASPEFLKIAPYNAAFAETMQMVKDFWNIPEYGPLLASTQLNLHNFIVGNQGTAESTMTTMMQEHKKILQDAGYPQ